VGDVVAQFGGGLADPGRDLWFPVSGDGRKPPLVGIGVDVALVGNQFRGEPEPRVQPRGEAACAELASRSIAGVNVASVRSGRSTTGVSGAGAARHVSIRRTPSRGL
jgi:hypothetical protein